MKYKTLPSFEDLWDRFEVALFTGKLHYKKLPEFSAFEIGDEAGCLDPNGYIKVSIGNSSFYAHRLLYKMLTGEDPNQYKVDHRNQIRDDNAFWNLRLDIEGRNPQNAKVFSNNKTGVKGVHYDKKARKYYATIWKKSKSIHLGSFDTIEDASNARKAAEAQYYGEWASNSNE